MKNRIASLILVFAMLMSLCTNAVARDNRIAIQSGGAERFTDVPPGPTPARHWAYDYIDVVVGSGLFNGKTPTTFEPSSAMTRSQFVLVMARMEGRSDLEGQVTQTIFPDVAPTRLAAGPIAWATEQGFVNGFGDGTFKPDSPITRGQFAALIHRYINYKGYVALKTLSPEPAQFNDASSVPNAFVGDVEYARTHGLLTGYSDGTVRASNPITRAAIAAILARFLDLVRESDYIPLLDYPRPTETSNLIIEEVNGANGSTAILSVMRGDTQVGSSASDAQPGDRVTISHVPQSGYHATVTAKDSDGYPVTITTDGNTSWFTMPSIVPVTVTVTYVADSSGTTPGTTVANPYDPTLKLTVTGETHGTTSVSATRGANGPAVSAGDLQKGDRVIVSHIPQTGYEASVIVRDGNGRRVAVTRTSDESSWFEMPSAIPVTVKVSYTSKSGGGGGGGSSGGGGGGGSSTRTYTFPVSATGVANPTEGGYVYLSLTAPNAFSEDFLENTEGLRFNASSTSTSSGSRTIYAVLTPASGYTFADDAISVSGGGAAALRSEFDNGSRLYALSAYGASRTETTSVTVTGFFKVATTPPEDNKVTWTVEANISNALVAVYATKPETVAAPTADSAKSATSAEMDKNATPDAMYLVVAPADGYEFPANFDDVITAATAISGFAATVARDASVTLEGVRAYTITPSAALTDTVTTTLTASMVQKQGGEPAPVLYAVSVKSTLDGVVPTDETVMLPAVNAPTGSESGQTVEFTAKYNAKYGGYEINSVKVVRVDAEGNEGAEVEAALKSDEDGVRTYTFTMPESDVRILVDYAQIQPKDLTYTVNVKATPFAALQSISVKIADETFTLPSDKTASDDGAAWPWTVSATADGWTITLTPKEDAYDDWAATSGYVGGTTFPIPVSVTAQPSANKGYEYVSISSGTIGEPQDLISGNSMDITATFRQVYTFGYKLTVNGAGTTVGGNFGDLTFDVATTDAVTETPARSYTTTSDSVSIMLMVTNPNMEIGAVTIDGVEVTSPTGMYRTTLGSDANDRIIPIVVSMRERNSVPVYFDLTVKSGGTVKVSSSDKIRVGNLNVQTMDRDTLNRASTSIDAPQSGGPTRYWVYSGAMVTLEPSSNDKTYSVAFADRNDREVSKNDESGAAGYSFRLSNSESGTKVTVSFAKLTAYNFLFQAPFERTQLASSLYSNSYYNYTAYKSAKLQDLLYSFNDGPKDRTIGRATENSVGIKNEFLETPDNLRGIVWYYLENGGFEKLEELLQGNIENAINVQAVVDQQLETLKKDPTSIKDGLTAAMNANSSVQALRGAKPYNPDTDSEIYAKALTEIRKNADLNTMLDEGQITVAVSATVHPVVMAEDESADGAPADLLTGTSVEKKLQGSISDHLNDISVSTSAKPTIRIDNQSTLGGDEIRLAVSATLDTPPTVTIAPAFNSYADGIKPIAWFTTSVSINATDSAVIAELDRLAASSNSPINAGAANLSGGKSYSLKGGDQPQLVDLSGVNIPGVGDISAIIGNALNAVDAQIRSRLAMTTVPMSAVLNNGTIRPIVQSFVNQFVDGAKMRSVESLGERANTRLALMSFYDNLVGFDKDESGNPIMVLKKKDGSNFVNAPVGSIDANGALVVTANFEKLLRDSGPDNTVYERAVDLLMALRDGLKNDIIATNDKVTPESVLAGLIERQIKERITVVQWGKTISGSQMSKQQRTEIAELIANFLMSDLSAEIDKDIWSQFEAKGYTSFSFKVDASRFAEIGESMSEMVGGTDIGFTAEQVLEEITG